MPSISATVKPTQPDMIPAALPPPRNFMGRKREIKKIVEAVTVSDSNAVIALLGMGGIGKTATAKQIAETVTPNFPGGIFWGDELSSTDGNPNTILRRWGKLCGQNLEKESEEDLPSILRGLLAARRLQLGPILAFVDDVRLDWSGGGISIIQQALPPDIPLIITTRQVQVAQEIGAKIHSLNVLSRAESCRLLSALSEKRIGGSNAETIAELCGDMPLALELIAKLSKTRESSWLLERLENKTNRLDVLKLDTASRKEQSVTISLEISYQALQDQFPETARMFRYLAVFTRPTYIMLKHLVDSFVQSGIYELPNPDFGNRSVRSDAGRISSKAAQAASANYENEVFVSYARGGESEEIVDQLEEACAEHGMSIVRDKKSLGYKDSIREFEERIGLGQCIILVISDQYLRSPNRMFELVEIAKNKNFHKRVFPIVLSDADIYNPINRIKYVKYWEEKLKELDEAIHSVNSANLQGIRDEIDNYDEVRDNISRLTYILKDMNTLTPEMHAQRGFSTLISAIESSLSPDIVKSRPAKSVQQSSKTSSKSELSPVQYRKSVEDDLLRLADWSLLMEVEAVKNNRMQYFFLHALSHEYAASLLVDKDEKKAAMRNHLFYCVSIAKANLRLDSDKQHLNTTELENSYGQLLHALANIKAFYLSKNETWWDVPQLPNQIITLVVCLNEYWQSRSQFDEQMEWLQVAYKCAEIIQDTIKQADFARQIGRVLSWQGRLEDALEWMKRAQGILGNNLDGEAIAVQSLIYIHSASIYFQKGELESAEDNCHRGIQLVNPKQSPRAYAEGNNLLGAIKIQNGQLESALAAFETSLSTWKQIDDQYQINRVEDNVRTVHYFLGKISHLRNAEEESLNYWKQFPYRIEYAMALSNRGLVHSIDGHHDTAIELQKRAMDISDLLGVPRMQAMTRVNIATAYIALEKYDEAEMYLEESLQIQLNHDIKEYWIDAKRSLAEVALGRKHPSDAIRLAMEAEQLASESDEPLELGTALRTLGEAHHLLGDAEQALKYLDASLSSLQDSGYKYETYLTLLATVKVLESVNNVEKVKEVWKEAQTLAEEMGLTSSNLTSNLT